MTALEREPCSRPHHPALEILRTARVVEIGMKHPSLLSQERAARSPERIEKTCLQLTRKRETIGAFRGTQKTSCHHGPRIEPDAATRPVQPRSKHAQIERYRPRCRKCGSVGNWSFSGPLVGRIRRGAGWWPGAESNHRHADFQPVVIAPLTMLFGTHGTTTKALELLLPYRFPTIGQSTARRRAAVARRTLRVRRHRRRPVAGVAGVAVAGAARVHHCRR